MTTRRSLLAAPVLLLSARAEAASAVPLQRFSLAAKAAASETGNGNAPSVSAAPIGSTL